NDTTHEAKSQAGPSLLPFRRVFELDRLSPAADIVRGMLGPKELALLWGEPSAAKTMTAVSLCASIATGERFFEHEIQHPGAVVYLAAEGAGGIRNRFEAWTFGRPETVRS